MKSGHMLYNIWSQSWLERWCKVYCWFLFLVTHKGGIKKTNLCGCGGVQHVLVEGFNKTSEGSPLAVAPHQWASRGKRAARWRQTERSRCQEVCWPHTGSRAADTTVLITAQKIQVKSTTQSQRNRNVDLSATNQAFSPQMNNTRT